MVFGFADAIWLLFLSRLIQGFGGGTTGVLQAYVADVTQPRDRAKALGWLSASTGAGVMIGPAIGSLAVALGPEVPGLIAAGLCVVNIGMASRWLPESRPGHGLQPERRSIRRALVEVVHSPRSDLPRLVWIYAVGMLGFMSMTAVMALYLESAFGVTERTIGPFFVYVGAMSVIMRAVVLGRLVDRFGETRVMRAGAVLLTIGLFTLPLPSSILMLGVVIALVPIGTACLFPSVTALITQRAAEHERGQTLGVQQAFGGVARVIAPVWSTAVFQGLGEHEPFFIAAAVVGIVSLLAFRVDERPHLADAAVAEAGGG